MSPPINIDGNSISGITIDGQEVQEVTIDGQVAYQNIIGKSNLVGWWKLDGDILDYSGNGNHGRNNGASITSGLGQSAYKFDGSNDGILVDSVGGGDANEITISAWVFQTGNANNSWERHVDFQNGSGGEFHTLRWDDDDKDYGYVADSYATLSQDPPLNTWLFWVGTTESDGTMKFYENATLKASSSSSFSSTTSSPSLGIGKRYDRSDYVQGKIQDVRIYDRALTSEEIETLYNRTVS